MSCFQTFGNTIWEQAKHRLAPDSQAGVLALFVQSLSSELSMISLGLRWTSNNAAQAVGLASFEWSYLTLLRTVLQNVEGNEILRFSLRIFLFTDMCTGIQGFDACSALYMQGRARFQLYQKLLALVFAAGQGWVALLYVRPFVPNFGAEWLIDSLATLVAGSVILGFVSFSSPSLL